MSTQILMPALSPTMEEGKIAKWHVKEGDAVKAGDILAEIETDKATMEFESIDEGRIGKILVPEGAEGVKVNVPIALLLGEGEQAPAAASSAPPSKPDEISAAMSAIRRAIGPATQKAEKAAAKAAAPVPPAAPEAPQLQRAAPPPPATQAPAVSKGNGAHPAEQPGGRIFASPLARRIAQQAGVDLASLVGSGPRGRIVKADVEAAGKSGTARPAPALSAQAPQPAAARAEASALGITPLPDARLFYKEGEYEAVPLDSMRKAIARRLTSAKTLIPHYYLTIDCQLNELMNVRARINEKSPKGEGAYKLSVNDFLIKAAAQALIRHPDVNASWTDTAILRHRHADVGVAVAIDGGLITPIVFKAELKGLVEISNEVRSLAERAKTKKLKPQEYEGGSFSISNLGMFGIKNFTAVINPPQAAIMAVGAGEERAIVQDGQFLAATIMTVTMSCDHRVIDGATGARFLSTFKSFVEEPAAMLL
jgi:pyruvate dehydrogenase E2 component (dihydrolipoamide acetyltransferase)